MKKLRRIDPDTEAGIKAAIKAALDTEQQRRDADYNEMVHRVLSHFDRFIDGGDEDGRPPA